MRLVFFAAETQNRNIRATLIMQEIFSSILYLYYGICKIFILLEREIVIINFFFKQNLPPGVFIYHIEQEQTMDESSVLSCKYL